MTCSSCSRPASSRGLGLFRRLDGNHDSLAASSAAVAGGVGVTLENGAAARSGGRWLRLLGQAGGVCQHVRSKLPGWAERSDPVFKA